jgi:hypothetical protein
MSAGLAVEVFVEDCRLPERAEQHDLCAGDERPIGSHLSNASRPPAILLAEMNKPSSKQSTKMRALTVREEAFIGAYISNGGNGAAAVKTAGYRCKAQGAAKVQAARMLTRANLSAEIVKRRAELRRVSNVSAQEVIAVLAAQMRSDITELLGKDASFDLERIRSATLGRLIKKLVLKRAVPTKRATARKNVQ